MELLGLILLVIGCLVGHTCADINLHMPRGTNNRFNENTRPRRNNKRLFDSQNNNRGGYNVGEEEPFHYVGSTLQVQWANQHSCGDVNNDCDVIIQYACGEQIRDGETTATIPNKESSEGNRRFGMNEGFYSFRHCTHRERNKGLFTSDQALKKDTARFTRQDNAGTRYGFECPEERDYYPYWVPTVWKDVAIFTNDPERCSYYKSESQNVKDKYYCHVHEDYLSRFRAPPRDRTIPITEEECAEFEYRIGREKFNGEWRRFEAHGIPAPKCYKSFYSRDNHQGNTVGGVMPNFAWTIPDDVSDSCVLRIRYNITSGEYNRDTTTAEHNNEDEDEDGNGPDVWSRHEFEEEEGVERGYKLVDDPEVNVFDDEDFVLQVAIDTSQLGRTFQDRSFVFGIRARPEDIPADAVIQNVNVRGKRGNIVQVFPAVEYDFTPNTVKTKVGDYVHFQWTGANTNPKNNAGQGTRGTDRSNVVQLRGPSYTEFSGGNLEKFVGQYGSSYPETIGSALFAGLSEEAKLRLAVFYPGEYDDLAELNGAPAYFDAGPMKVRKPGVYHYMCTRNNNFTNRSQKGRLIVTE